MKSESSIVAERIENVIMLDSEIFSSQWERIWKKDTSDSPQDKQLLSMVLPIPDHDETLIIYRDKGVHYTKKPYLL